MNDEPSFGNSFRRAVLNGERRVLVVGEKQRRLNVHDESLDGAIVPRSEIRRSDHRGRDRHRLNGETATVIYRRKSRKVEVVNLSSGGAMIRARFTPRLWDMMELQLGDGPGMECAVRWLRDGLVGLEFAHETRIDCDPEMRAKLLLDVIQRSFPDTAVDLEPLDEVEEKADYSSKEDEDLGNRNEVRHPLVWSGQILYQFDSNPARLRNISTGGALVDVTIAYPVGADVMLDLGDAGQFDCVVSWAHGSQVGLRFKQEFDLECLTKLRPDLTPYRWTKPEFLNRAADESTPWDEEWRRLSLTELQQKLEGFLKH